MSQVKDDGLVVLAIRGVLLFLCLPGSQAPVDQISEALTGRFTDNTMA